MTAAKGVVRTDADRKFDYYFYEAMRLQQLSKYDAAYEMLKHCLALNPNSAVALFEFSQYQLLFKKNDEALALIKKAVELEPGNYWYNQGLVNLYMQQNKSEEALHALEAMVDHFPQKTDLLYTLAGLYGNNEQEQKMLETLEMLEQKMGKNEQLSLAKIGVYKKLKQDDKTLEEIKELIKEYPANNGYKVLLGDALREQERGGEAYKIYRDVLAAEPDNPLAMYSLAQYYESVGDTLSYQRMIDSLVVNKKTDPETRLTTMQRIIVKNEEAGRDSTQVIKLFDRVIAGETENAELPLLYAQYLISKNMEDKAMPVIEQVLDIDPTHSLARMVLLEKSFNAGQYDKAMALCEGGIQAEPTKLEYYYYLTVCYFQKERYDDIISTVQKAEKQLNDESDKEMASNLYAAMGYAYNKKKMSAEAFAAYDKSLAYNPDNIETLNNYAYYLSVEQKDLDKAEEMSYKTIKAEPSNGTFLDTYAWILYQKGNYEQAKIYIDMALKDQKEEVSAEVWEHAGDIYLKTGNAKEAVEYWQKAQKAGSTSKTLKEKIQAYKKHAR